MNCDKPTSCVGCPYYSRPMVWGTGPVDAKLVILGQNPGDNEVAEGQPFVGASGRVLNRALYDANISRERSFVSNVVKCWVKPGEPIDPKAVKMCRPLLDIELDQLPRAQTILTLGQEAFDELSGKELQLRHNRKSAEKNPRAWLRGCPFPISDRVWIIPTVHPSFVMRTGFAESPLFIADIRKAGRFAFGGIRPPVESYVNNPSTSEVVEYIRTCVENGEFGLDIETPETGLDDDELDPLVQTPIEVVGLSARVGEAIGVRPDQIDLLRPLFDGSLSPQSPPICWTYNAGFDLHHLGKRFPLVGIRSADALIGFHLLWSHLQVKDLATCMSIYTDVPYYKNWRKIQPELYDTVGNARDTYGALNAGREMLSELRGRGMEELFWSMQFLPTLFNEWRLKGVRVNTELAMRQSLYLRLALKKYEEVWNKLIPNYDWSSPKQLAEHVFPQLGMPLRTKRRPNGKSTPCVDDEVLEEYANKRGCQVARLVQEMRTLRKADDFFTMQREDGKIHPRFTTHAQVGGRLQASDGNVQQIPEKVAELNPRETVVGDNDGDLVITSDFSQIELWIYAWYTKCKNLLAVKDSGDYVYGAFYEWIFEKPFFNSIGPRNKKNRASSVQPWELLVAKSWPLGFIYGRGVPDPGTLPISRGRSREIFERFHRENPEIRPFHENLVIKAERQGFLQTVFGRMRRFPNAKGQRTEVLAFPGQTTAVDILIRNALRPLSVGLPQFSARSLFSVHDSVVATVKRAYAKECARYINNTMQSPIPEMNNFYIPAETKIGTNWGNGILWEDWSEDSERTTDVVQASAGGPQTAAL